MKLAALLLAKSAFLSLPFASFFTPRRLSLRRAAAGWGWLGPSCIIVTTLSSSPSPEPVHTHESSSYSSSSWPFTLVHDQSSLYEVPGDIASISWII